jgi:RNA polymerase sigma-70 factor (ECF subfamily)
MLGQLMQHVRNGSQAAFEELYRLCAPGLYRNACRRLSPRDAEEVVHDTLLLVYRKAHLYDPGRPGGPWIWAIHRRAIASKLRRVAPQTEKEYPLPDPEDGEILVTPEDYFQYERMLAAQERCEAQALEALTEDQRVEIRRDRNRGRPSRETSGAWRRRRTLFDRCMETQMAQWMDDGE